MQCHNSVVCKHFWLLLVSSLVFISNGWASCEDKAVIDGSNAIEHDLTLVQSFCGQHLSTILPKQKTKKNFPSGGLREDVMALTKWLLSNNPEWAKTDFEPISVTFVLSGEFSSNSAAKMNDLQVVTDDENRKECLVAWYYDIVNGRTPTLDITCLCIPKGERHAIQRMRSFDLIAGSWKEVKPRSDSPTGKR